MVLSLSLEGGVRGLRICKVFIFTLCAGVVCKLFFHIQQKHKEKRENVAVGGKKKIESKRNPLITVSSVMLDEKEYSVSDKVKQVFSFGIQQFCINDCLKFSFKIKYL